MTSCRMVDREDMREKIVAIVRAIDPLRVEAWKAGSKLDQFQFDR